MKAHTIKVAVDKEFIINEINQATSKPTMKDITVHFNDKKVKFVTTFTSQAEHFRILGSLTAKLSREEQFLQLKFRDIGNGKEMIDAITSNNITKENIEYLPDFIVSNDVVLAKASATYGIPVIGDALFNQNDVVKLSICKTDKYFVQRKQLPFWRIRIEDRYLIKNIGSEREAERLFEFFDIKDRVCYIEIVYSDEDYDYVSRNSLGLKDFVDRAERERRKNMIRSIGMKHNIRYFINAGHDRYLCTNSSLFIFGNSITSDKETHITYFPFIKYYKDYFNLK